MLSMLVALMLGLCWVSDVFCVQSTITETDRYACMGEDKSRKHKGEIT
jgi:hypothetical protein